ncbi:phosphatidylinositol 3-kinase [Myriangium duriaei CBS 260.36]|uniref:Phosphatidylinositol 3-kinase VPS34 n=1 Tax=Myriangium duriaei CBS 260.36 TaxID=1168546 RepID=A0A9P4JB15_9PEZI|nr:phosphatidylinositol 3-kinase [Myriangium duriaei CBS 260.36]
MDTFTFASSSELKLPVSVKVGRLEGYEKPLPYSKLLRQPDLRHRGSNLSPTFELYVTAQLFADSKPLTVHSQTPYKHFKTLRAWNEWLQLPIDYSTLPSNAQLAITVWDLSPTGPEGSRGHHIPFGGTTISLFDEDGALRKGRQKCKLWRHKAADGYSHTTTPWTPPKSSRRRDYEEPKVYLDDKHSRREAELERLQGLLKKHEMGEIPENKWLDQMVFRQIEKMERANLRDSSRLQGSHPRSEPNGVNVNGDSSEDSDGRDSLFYLHIEFPRFDHPVVFTDHEYPPPPISSARRRVDQTGEFRLKPPPEVQPGPGIDTKNPGYGDAESGPLIRIYDPEVGFNDNPAEVKHRSLVRGQRTGMLDKHLKPNPRVRDRLNVIMSYGPTKELSGEERDLVWKFRHHLTRDKRALTKLVKSVAWGDANEVRQVSQLLPKWEEIDVDDALELLGPQFDNRDVRTYAVDRLRKADDDELLLYLLQLVQALKFEPDAKADDTAAHADSSLAGFLVARSAQNLKLGNYLHWYLMVELDDRTSQDAQAQRYRKLYARVSYDFMQELEKTPEGQARRKTLLRQGEFITVLAKLSEDARSSREDRQRKIEKLKKALADPKNDMLKIDPPLPLPLDPNIHISGCFPDDSSVFKSSLSPLLVNYKTAKGEKYPLIFKSGDNLRQDQLVMQIISLMDRLLLKENLNLQLSPYRILATGAVAGAVQFVPSAPLSAILSSSKYKGSILEYLRKNNPAPPPTSAASNTSPSILGVRREAMDTYVKSCAGYCVITYLLGVGDRHMDNLLLSPDGHFFHADFGYILGRDPKPLAPSMKLSHEMIDGMGGLSMDKNPDSQFQQFRQYCFTAFTALRRSSNLILNLFALMQDANIPDIRFWGDQAVKKVEERFCLGVSEDEAIAFFDNLISRSLEAWGPVVIDRLHGLVQGWRT